MSIAALLLDTAAAAGLMISPNAGNQPTRCKIFYLLHLLYHQVILSQLVIAAFTTMTALHTFSDLDGVLNPHNCHNARRYLNFLAIGDELSLRAVSVSFPLFLFLLACLSFNITREQEVCQEENKQSTIGINALAMYL